MEQIDQDIESQVISKLTRRVTPFLLLLYLVGYLDRINVGFAALQMQQQLGFNDVTYGLGMGMFFAGYCCFQVVARQNSKIQNAPCSVWVPQFKSPTWALPCGAGAEIGIGIHLLLITND